MPAEVAGVALRACARWCRRRRVCWLSLIFACACDFDLAGVCVLVLMCAAQLTPARGRPSRLAASTLKMRRKTRVPLDIFLISLPGVLFTSMHAGCQQVVTRPESSPALIVRDLSRFWQRKNSDLQKH